MTDRYDLDDVEAWRRANAIDQERRDTACPYCAGTGADPGEPTFDPGRPLPETPEEVERFLSRRFGKLRRAAARRGNHLVSATSATGFRSAGARQFDEAELAFIRVALALLERYAGELSETRNRR